MAVASQTITRNDLRAYAYARNTWMDGNRDHVYSHSPALAIFLGRDLGNFGAVTMRGRGVDTVPGGHTGMIRVRLGKHAGSKRMAGAWDTHSTSPDENTRLGEFNYKDYSGALVISEKDKATHRGPDAMGSFVGNQTEEVTLSLADTLATDLWATSPASNAITSIDDLVSAASETASVQNLSGSTYDNYNSRGVSARGTVGGSISFASGPFSTQGIADMRTCFNNASEGSIQPNVVFVEYATHERYEGALQPQERYAAPARLGDASFQALAFRTVPVMADPNVASGYLYMLRVGSDGIQMKVLNGYNLQFAPFKPGSNTETFVSELMWKGQLIIHNRRYVSNTLTGITD